MSSDYTNLTQGQENAATGKYDFWANVFTKFNPQAPQQTPVNTSPMFNAATQSTLAGMPNTSQSGNFHSGRVAQRIGMSNDAMANKANFQNENAATFYNPQEAMKYGEAGIGRMNLAGNVQDRINQLPQDRNADRMAQLETNQNTEDRYNATKGDFFSSLLGGLGSIGGTLLGKKMGSKPAGLNGPYAAQENFASDPFFTQYPGAD